MRVVVDTNVIVSGLMSSGGTCARIVEWVIDGDVDPALDDRILAEYGRVLARPSLRLPPEERVALLDLLRVLPREVGVPHLDADMPDETDRPFLEVAALTDAILVTGNRRHFPPDVCGDVRVMAPAEFIDTVAREGADPE